MIAKVRTWVSGHKPAAAALGVLGLAAAVFVVVWFEPQKLVIDERVDEAAPIASPVLAASPEVPAMPAATTVPIAVQAQPAAPSAAAALPTVPPAAASTAPPASSRLLSGSFRSLEHETTGTASVTQLADGSRILRFEGFATSNGPDLRVYLSAGSNDAFFGKEYGNDYVELGELKGNIGSQNYSIPAGVDLAKYRNAVVWCKRFSVGFGVATLAA